MTETESLSPPPPLQQLSLPSCPRGQSVPTGAQPLTPILQPHNEGKTFVQRQSDAQMRGVLLPFTTMAVLPGPP